jgi:hypothetical protein
VGQAKWELYIYRIPKGTHYAHLRVMGALDYGHNKQGRGVLQHTIDERKV